MPHPTPRERLSLYLRLIRFDRPIGSFLLLWPTWWGLWLASDGNPSFDNLVIFTAGVFLMRSAGPSPTISQTATSTATWRVRVIARSPVVR